MPEAWENHLILAKDSADFYTDLMQKSLQFCMVMQNKENNPFTLSWNSWFQLTLEY